MRENVRYYLQLETDLRQAIQKQELVINYEPIVNIASGQTISLEALLRWRHPKRGIISPSEFISLAEETGLIIPIGEWVLTEACRQMQTWHNQFPSTQNISVSVNLSSKQFSQSNLPVIITNILSATGYNPSRLTLEITESIIIENKEQTIRELNQLREMGIQIHMDDFGTGYSSLVYLHLLPLNAIKIDRSFVSGTRNPTNGLEIVRTIIHLANDLHMETVAEGVETHEQLRFLKAMGCSHIQGYLLTKPMDPSKTEYLLSKQLGKFNISTFR
jgi:EAL domain-containing protein (putative c-di-GMP-specific phosphodiesterase class I)